MSGDTRGRDFHRQRARVRAMGIRDRPTSFRSPWQNGYADHLIAFNADHLRRILAKYAIYYNEMRTHVSLGKDAPYTRPIERFGEVVAHPIFGGLPPGGFGFGSGTGEHNQRLTSRAMAKAAAAAREPTIAVCKALRSGATPVNWPLTPPKISRAARVSAIETGSARETVSSRK
jgi:hypothetical protein